MYRGLVLFMLAILVSCAAQSKTSYSYVIEDSRSEDKIQSTKSSLSIETDTLGDNNKTLNRNFPIIDQLRDSGARYVINDDFDLNGQVIKLPENSILEFRGGSFYNGELVGNKSIIKSDHLAFRNVTLSGTWTCVGEVHWFAEASVLSVNNLSFVKCIDATEGIQKALDSSFSELHIRPGYYYITSTLFLRQAKDIRMDGGSTSQYLFQRELINQNKTVIFTDQNVTMLKIQLEDAGRFSRAIKVEGGNFDVSLCGPRKYHKNCIEVDITSDRKLWGFDFDSAIWGTYSSFGQKPTGTGLKFLTDSTSRGYATMIRLNSDVSWFETGLDIVSNGKNWITDVIVDGVISSCAIAIRTNADVYVDASIQPTYFFKNADNQVPVVELLGGRVVLRGMIWDCGLSMKDGRNLYYSNSVAINIGDTVQSLNLEGKLRDIYPWYSKRIIGNRTVLTRNSMSRGDVFSASPDYSFNYFEAFLNRGGLCSIKLYDAKGAIAKRQYKVIGEENLFKIEEGGMSIDFLGSNPFESEYLDIKLENINVPLTYVGLSAFVQYNAGKYSTNFGVCELIMELEGVDDKVYTSISSYEEYSRIRNYDFYNSNQYVCKSVTFRLRDIKGNIHINKVFANKLVNKYSKDFTTFLPISGGNVYNNTNFENLCISNYPICPSEDKLFIDKDFSLIYKSKKVAGVGCNSIFIIKSNNNPTLESHTLIISSVNGVAPTKTAIYQFNVVGYTGNTKLEIKKLSGNADFVFVVYKKNDINANYIVYLSSPSNSSYGYVVSKVNSDSSTAFDYIDITEEKAQSDGYNKYTPVIVRTSGSSAQRPSHSYVGKGFQYFDTDLNRPIWSTGSNWVDSTGKIIK